MPADERVPAGRDVGQLERAVGRRNREIRMIEDEDRGAHVRVDVAEHLHQARLVESLAPRLASRVPAQVERRRRGQREHVVEERIAVGKFDRRSARDRQHVRDERLVFLPEFRFRRAQRTAERRILQVDDDVADFGDGGGGVFADRSRRVDVGGQRRADARGQFDAAADGTNSGRRAGVRCLCPRSGRRRGETHECNGMQKHDRTAHLVILRPRLSRPAAPRAELLRGCARE